MLCSVLSSNESAFFNAETLRHLLWGIALDKRGLPAKALKCFYTVHTTLENLQKTCKLKTERQELQRTLAIISSRINELSGGNSCPTGALINVTHSSLKVPRTSFRATSLHRKSHSSSGLECTTKHVTFSTQADLFTFFPTSAPLSPNQEPEPSVKLSDSFEAADIYRQALCCILLPVSRDIPSSSPFDIMSLLRKAFGFSTELHSKYVEEATTLSRPEVVVSQLCDQLNLVEHEHPIYRNRSKKCRSEWKDREQAVIKKLLQRIRTLHFSHLREEDPIPGCTKDLSIAFQSKRTRRSKYRTDLTLSDEKPTDCRVVLNYHEYYTILLHHLLQVEDVLSFVPSSKGGTRYRGSLSCYLSPEAKWLLEEFGERFGVRKLYRELVFLSILVKSFDPTSLEFMSLLHSSTDDSTQFIKNGEIITDIEVSMIYSISTTLHSELKTTITSALCESSNPISPNMLKLTLQIFATLEEFDSVAIESSLRSDPQRGDIETSYSYRAILFAIVQEATEKKFSNLIKVAQESHSETDLNAGEVPPPGSKFLSCKQTELLFDLVLLEIGGSFALADTFRGHVNIVSLVHEFLCKKMEETVKNTSSTLVEHCTPRAVFDLHAKAYHFYKQSTPLCDTPTRPRKNSSPLPAVGQSFLLRACSPSLHNSDSFKNISANFCSKLEEFFSPFYSAWIETTSSSFHRWAENSCAIEKWQPLALEQGLSSSLFDIFSMLEEPMKFLLNYREVILASTPLVFKQYVNVVVNKIVIKYTKRLQNTFCNCLQESSENCAATHQKFKQIWAIIVANRPCISLDLQHSIEDDRGITPMKEEESESSPKHSRLRRLSAHFSFSSKRRQSRDNIEKEQIQTLETRSSFPFISRLHPRSRKRSKRRNAKLNQKMCVCANNVEGCMQQLDILMSPVDHIDFSCFNPEHMLGTPPTSSIKPDVTETFEVLRCALERFKDFFVNWISDFVSKEIEKVITKSHKQNHTLDRALDYLDEQLSVLSSNLSSHLFDRVLSQLWNHLTEEIALFLAPHSHQRSKLHSCHHDMLISVLDELRVFFHADGKGLSEHLLENSACMFVRGITTS